MIDLVKNKPELISFKLCPFVNRSVITLLEKGVDFDINYVDIFNKPDWFSEISPMGKVPLLKIGDAVIFESAVINEFLDEVTPGSLHPSDPIQRAHNRAWIEFGGNLIMTQYHMFSSKDEESFEKNLKSVQGELEKLEAQCGGGPFFNGKEFNLIDAAYAPIFRRFDTMRKYTGFDVLEQFPRLRAWSEILLSRDSVKKSVVADFDEIFAAFFQDTHMGHELFSQSESEQAL